jgi:hypothetical protein
VYVTPRPVTRGVRNSRLHRLIPVLDLNPHLLAVSTVTAATSEGTIYLVDGVRGTIIYQVSHANLDTTLGIEVSLLENWLVYRFRVEGVVATAGVPSGHRIVTVELFERGVAADKISS